MKILNLYAGIGGNRKLWPDEINGEKVEVTAVEINPEIAAIYQDYFPEDEVVVADAHEYLLEHYNDGWDFIWSSPPCPTHSRIRNIAGVGRGQEEPVYPDMKLYQEIIFLMRIARSKGINFVGKYVVENVKPDYEPLITPQESGRHFFWSNFHISEFGKKGQAIHTDIVGSKVIYGYDLNEYDYPDKRRLLRNCVNPKLGLHIFNCAFKEKQKTLLEG